MLNLTFSLTTFVHINCGVFDNLIIKVHVVIFVFFLYVVTYELYLWMTSCMKACVWCDVSVWGNDTFRKSCICVYCSSCSCCCTRLIRSMSTSVTNRYKHMYGYRREERNVDDEKIYMVVYTSTIYLLNSFWFFFCFDFSLILFSPRTWITIFIFHVTINDLITYVFISFVSWMNCKITKSH